MPIDYNALGVALGAKSQEPVLGTEEINPDTGLTFSEKDVKSIESRLLYGGAMDVFPGYVDKPTLRVLSDAGYYPQHGDEYTRLQLAREQGSFGQLANALNQAVVGEVVGGTLEGIGYMLDLQQYADLINKKEEDFGNALSEAGKALRTWTKEVSPIYVSPHAKQYDPGNWAWWMNNFPSVASTLSLMIPSAGVIRGLGTLGNIGNVGEKALLGMSKVLQTSPEKVSWMVRGVGQAMASRHMENLMEAGGVYEEQYKLGKGLGMSDYEAKKFASVGASNTYQKQWLLLLQDIPQYLLLNRLGGAGKSITSTKVARALGVDPGMTVLSKGATVLKDMIGEGGEEMYQYLINEQSKLLAQRMIDPNVNTSFSRVWQDNYDSGEMWTAATFGAFGAGVMQVGFAGLNAKAMESANKARIQEVTSRGKVFAEAYKEYQNALDSGDPIRKRQAMAILENTLAINSVGAGNEKYMMKMVRDLTEDPTNDEVLKRSNIDPQQSTILKDNPEIADRLEEKVRRVYELQNSFAREVAGNSRIAKENRDGYTQLMVWNQLMLESAKEEKATIEKELADMSGAAERFNQLTTEAQAIQKIQSELFAIHNKDHEIGSDNPYKKPGVLDILSKRLKENGDKMNREEKASYEERVAFYKLKLAQKRNELKEAKKAYTDELKEKDKDIAVTDDEIVPLMSQQLRLEWADAAIESLSKQQEAYRRGDELSDEEDTEEAPEEDAKKDNYDPATDIYVNDNVKYTDEEGNIREGRVQQINIAETDETGKPIGRQGESSQNVYTIQPLKDGKPDGATITKFGGDVTLDRSTRETIEDATNSIDPVDTDTQKAIGVSDEEVAEPNLESPVAEMYLSYAHYDKTKGKLVSRHNKLSRVLSDPQTSYEGSVAEIFFDPTQSYISELNNRLKVRLKELNSAPERNKKEISNLRSIIKYMNKFQQGKILSEEEAKIFVTAINEAPANSPVDELPISVVLTVEGKEYGRKSKNLYLHAGNFDKVPLPAKVREQMAKNPEGKAKQDYLNKVKAQARATRSYILSQVLTGDKLYSKGIKVGSGAPNSLSTNLKPDQRALNITKAFGIAANKIKFAITKAGAANPYYSFLWTGGDDRVPGVRFGGEGNLFVVTDATVNGKTRAVKMNTQKMAREHADIVLDAFRNIGKQEHDRRAKAYLKYKDDSKISKDVRYNATWAKQYNKVVGLTPAETIDLLVVHGRKGTDPNSTTFKARLRNNEHKAELQKKTLFLDVSKTKAVLYYGYNSETETPYEMNLLDDADIAPKRNHFIEWAHQNKNYAAHLIKPSLGLELNQNFLEKRNFTIGAVNQLKRTADQGYNEFLINNMMFVTDVEQYTPTGLVFINPTVDLNITSSAGEVALSKKNPKEQQPTATEQIRKKQPVPQAEENQTAEQKHAAKNKIITSQEELDAELKRIGGMREGRLAMTDNAAEKEEINAMYDYRVERAKALFEDNQKEEEPNDDNSDPLADIDDDFKVAMEATEEVKAKREQITLQTPDGKQVTIQFEDDDPALTKKYRDKVTAVEKDLANKKIDVAEYEKRLAALQKEFEAEIDSKHKIAMEAPLFESLRKEGKVIKKNGSYAYIGIKKINLEKELNWVAKKVNLHDIKVVDRLLKITGTGRRAYALYGHDATLLYEGAAEGALYHEAWHRVSLGYLTAEERDSLYRTASTVYKIPIENKKALEERLAEEFREYTLSRDKTEQPKQHSGIRRVLQKIYEWIKNVFAGPSRLRENDIDRMFQQIYAGKYANAAVLEENLDNLRPGEYAMMVGRHIFQTMNSSKQRNDIVRKLAYQTIKLSGIEDLNNVKNGNKPNPAALFQWVDKIVKQLGSTKKYTDAADKDRADQLKAIFTEVSKNKAIFWDLIVDHLSDIGIRGRRAALTESDILAMEQNQEVIGNIEYDKRSNWEVSLKDNAMASVKYTISKLHASSEIDPFIGIRPYVDANRVWAQLLYHLHAFENIYDMVDELKALGAQDKNSPWFTELAEELEDASTNTKNQFVSTFNIWKHDFLSFEFNYNGRQEEYFINLIGNSEEQLARNKVQYWNESMYLDPDIVGIDKNGVRTLNKDFFVQLEQDYQNLISLVEEDITNGNIESRYLDDHIDALVELLNRLHIQVDAVTIEKALNDFYTDEMIMDRMLTMLDADMKLIFGRESALYKEAALSEKTEQEKIEPVRLQSAFILNPILFKSEKSLSKAYAMAHPEEQENVVIGAEGNKYFTYAQNNMVTDIVRKLKHDDEYLAKRRKLMNNRHSLILKYLQENQNIRDAFYLRTFSAFKGRAANKNFKQITPLEEYIARYNAIINGYLPMPVMANRKQFFYMSGIPTLEDTVVDINTTKNKIELKFNEDVLDVLYGYFLDEKDRVIAAYNLREEYTDPTTPKERKEVIRKQLIKNYHYGKDGDLTKGNAYKFQHFKAFNKHTDPRIIDGFDEKEVKQIINKMLNNLFQEEYKYAAQIGAISRDGVQLGFDAMYSYKGRELERTIGEDDLAAERESVTHILADFMVNSMVGVFESEKVFFADPAFFKTDEGSEFDVADDMYKRWFGVGSTGARLATDGNMGGTFNVGTLNTQKFKSAWYESIYNKQVQLYKDAGVEESEAKRRVKFALHAFTEVDPTDGTMLISPEMFKEISLRLGLWPSEKEKAYKLLISDKKLSPEEEIAATGVVMQPLKTVYMGKQEFNGLDLVIYDKMSMATIFRRQVKGGPLEEVLDRMEAVGDYTGLEKIHAFKYDSATKIGGQEGVDLFTDVEKRDKVSDLSDLIIQRQLFDNLKHQVVTDVHDVDRQLVGTQAYKVISSNIIKDKEYSGFGSGENLLEQLTLSREALSNLGKEKVKARLGIKGTRITNSRFISMLSNDAKEAKKSYDFIQALTVDENGDLYLELDAFPDRRWVYSRISSLISKETVDLNLPGNQLIQVSDYGYSYGQDLAINHPEESGITELEVRVSTRLFRNVIPNYDKLTHEQRVKYLKNELKFVGYRIPTQGQNSTVRLRVVDFLREQSGDIIQLPLEFTALTGSDFDIDKLFVMGYNYDKLAKKKGLIERVKFRTGNSQVAIDGRYELKAREIFNIYHNNPEVIGQDIYDEVSQFKQDKAAFRGARNEYYSELEAAYAVRNEIMSKKEVADDAALRQEYVDVNDRIAVLETNMQLAEDWVDSIEQAKLNTIIEKLVNQGILPSREAFEGLSLQEQNTREANENRILDIFDTVLGDDKHYLQTSTPLGALTGVLKDKAAFVTEAYGEKKELMSLETTTPRYQSMTRATFIGADQGIGAFALSNAHHSLTQHADFGIKSEVDLGFRDQTKVDEEDVVWFNKIMGKDGKPVMDWLSALIDAHVDAAKDPYIIRLNVNDATMNVVSYMIRAGVGETTFDFLSQPILRHYAREYINATGDVVSKEIGRSHKNDAHNYAKEKVMELWADKIGMEVGDFELTATLPQLLNQSQLQDDIKNSIGHMKLSKSQLNKYVARQLSILEQFNNIVKDAKLLNRVVMASRIDTKRFGSTPVEMRHFMNSVYSLEEMKDQFINLDKLIQSSGERVEGGTMLSTLLKNSLIFTLETMSDKSVYGSRGFSTLFGKILEVTPSGYYTDQGTITTITEELFSALISEFFVDVEDGLGVTKEMLHDILADPKKSVFNQLHDIKSKAHKYYNDLKDNRLLNMMTVDYNERFPLSTFIRIPFHTLSDKGETDDYTDDFIALLQHQSPEVRDLAKRLYIYSYFTSGWRQRRHSFHTYIPAMMQKEIEVNKNKYVSYNEFIKKLRQNLADDIYVQSRVSGIKRHFFRNNWYDTKFVPGVEESFIEREITKGDQTVGYEMDFSFDRNHYQGRTLEKHHVFTPYILLKFSEEEGNYTTLLEYAGYSTKTLKPIYRIVPKKGFLDAGVSVREYGLKKEASILKKNNVPFVSETEFGKLMGENAVHMPFKEQIITDKTRFQDAFMEDYTRASEKTVTVEKVESIPTTKVISGGQTGADRIGLEAAKAAGVETGGFAPPGFVTERGPDITLTDFGVTPLSNEEQAELGSESFWTARTEKNVKESDGTLYFDFRERGKKKSKDKGGLGATINYAKKHGKFPEKFLIVGPEANPDAIRQWLVEEDIKTLNIAGNRGSTLITTEANRIKEILLEVFTGERIEAFAGNALSTHSNPIKIYIDGSSVPKFKHRGYGAFFTWNGKNYNLSGTNADVDRILRDYKEQFAERENPIPTIELIGMLETLRKLSGTSEHLYILTDQENNVNYEGIWERAVVNKYRSEAKKGEHGKRTKPTVPNATGSSPWITYLVDEIVKQIEKIEANGGSVRIQWIPGHINEDRVAENTQAFANELGARDDNTVIEHTNGNNMADDLAKSTKRISNFLSLNAPQFESIARIQSKAIDKQESRSENNEPIC